MNFSRWMPGLAASLLLAACSDRPGPDTVPGTREAGERPATAYRVRARRDAPLDAESSWAAQQSVPATVPADSPFRVRLELAPPDDLDTDCLRLQYRRNTGEWLPIEAHDFPYPLRELELSFAADAAGTRPAGWRVASGADDGVGVVMDRTMDPTSDPTTDRAIDKEGAVLRFSAQENALIALYPAPWRLEGAFSFAAEYRLAADGPRAVSLVFGYRDPANHWRLTLDAANGQLRVVHLLEGVPRIVAEQKADVRAGVWQEAEVQLEDGVLEIDFDDGALGFRVPADGPVPAAVLGLQVPPGGSADFRSLAIEGPPSSPRVSIVSTDAYRHGTPTGDLLPGATTPYSEGFAVNLTECASIAVAAGLHTELEWPLVIRRFADGAVTNEPGDVFTFRLADAEGRAVRGAPEAVVELDVAAGHLGGTFVETPGRIGPWRAASGALYFIMEPAESDNLFMVVKSSDGGRSWREVDGARRPATGDLESVDARLVGDTLHILHQVTEATYYHALRTADHPHAPDTWAVTDERVATVTARAQMASLVVREDGGMVAFYVGESIGYSVRSADGAWGEAVRLDDGEFATSGPQAVLGADGVVHLAYHREDGTIWHRRLLPDDTLSAPRLLDSGAGRSEEDIGAVLPLVLMPESGTVVVVYRLADGRLRERRIRGDGSPTPPVPVAKRRVVQNAVDSQQAGADAVAWEAGVLVAFIDEADRSLYTTIDRGAGWEPPRARVEGIVGSWVRGNVYRRADGATVYGYVYDAGSLGGAGMNRYGEVVLADAPAAR
mgnify:FL=1